MRTFIAVDDELLSQRIMTASRRIIFVAPALSTSVSKALGKCFNREPGLSITIVLDPDEEAYRVGYGDREGLEHLQQLAKSDLIGLRSQPGLRIGLLVVDEAVLVWSPTPKSVEGQRAIDQPNGVDLGGRSASNPDAAVSDKDAAPTHKNEAMQTSVGSLIDTIRSAVGADDADIPLEQAEIGRAAFTPEDVAETIKVLTENPPAPFDLARKTRVFSSKFQFVEFEVRGAAWTKREIKLSSLLLNPDIADDLQDLFETRVRPFLSQADAAIGVPTLVLGQIAYNRQGEKIMSPMTQADVDKAWNDLVKRYLRRLEGFGWLIRREDKERFQAEAASYETVLKEWVAGFRTIANNEEKALVARIVDLVKARADRSSAKEKLKDIDIDEAVRAGIQKLRVTEPSVKLVFKDISWESTRDDEFMQALRTALPPEALTGWFEVFTAARERAP